MRQVMAIPSFRRIWISQLVSMFGDFLALYAVIAMVSFRMHGTPREVTLISVFFLLPLALIGPIAGVFVDRWDPKRTMIVSDLARGVLILGLAFAHAPEHVYAVLFAISVFSSFFMPSQSVVIPQIVPMEGLLSANASIQQAMQFVRILSPAISGALVGYLGGNICYYLDSVSFFISALLLSSMSIPPRPPHINKEMKSMFHEISSGMRFIFGHEIVAFVILSIAAGMFALGAYGALVAVYVRDVLHMGSTTYGTIGSLVGAGMLIGGMLITKFAAKIPDKARLIVIGLLACGVNIGLIAFFGNFLVTALGSFGVGLSASLLIIPSMTIMQGQVPHEMRGRVSSSSMSLMTLAQGVALLFAGDFASRLGITVVYYASAAMLVIIAGFGYSRLRRMT